MKYPKEIMTTKELIAMGFPKHFLNYISSRYNQKVCWKMSDAKNAKLLWSSEELEKERKNLCVGKFPESDYFD